MRLLILGVPLVLISLTAPSSFAQPQTNPIVEFAAKHDTTTRTLREMIAPPEAAPAQRIVPIELIPTRAGLARPLSADQVEQTSPGGAPAFTLVRAFKGLGKDFAGFQMTSVPPDTTGAVGDTQFVQAVNTSLIVFRKDGTRDFGPILTQKIWQGFGTACERENDGDPIVLFDRIANRWVITQFQVTDGNSQCIAISTTSDAGGTYHRYEFRYPSMNDYPKIGVWPDAYYVTYNMFGNPQGGRACAWERDQMLAGARARQVCFQLSNAFWSLMPADLDGRMLPPAGAPNPMLSLGADFRSLDLWRFHVDWADPTLSTFGRGPNQFPNVSIPVASFNDACRGTACIEQPATTQKLDSLGDRLMMRAAYRRFAGHDAVVVNHSVDTSNASSGVRWYEIRDINTAPAVFQQGTFTPDGASRWMGSVAMDATGNLLAGYSVGGAALRPSIRVAGRTPFDPAGQLSAELTLVSGSGSQTQAERWGDYSQMSIDPSDDCTFWFTTEYMKGTGKFNWDTHIGAYRFNRCNPTAAPAAIVFVSSVEGNRDIYSMAADGSGLTRLTTSPAADYAPSISEGRIVFISERDGNAEVYSMNLDGSDQRRLTTTAAAEEQPVWIGVSGPAPVQPIAETAPAPAPAPAAEIGEGIAFGGSSATWGGPGAALMLAEKPKIEFACAEATLNAPLPESGPFDIRGVYVPERGGPERIDIPSPAPQPARFIGRVEEGRISIRVQLDNGQVLGQHELRRGERPRLVKCRM